MTHKTTDINLLDAAWDDPRLRVDMPRIHLKVKYETIDRAKKRGSQAPHPSFDTDDDVEVFLMKAFRKLWKFWAREYIVDFKLALPPFDTFVEMMEFGADADNDLRSTLMYYLDSFFPYVPEDKKLRKIDHHQKQDDGVLSNDELYYVADYILTNHQVA